MTDSSQSGCGKKRNLFDKREHNQARLSYAERRKVAYEIQMKSLYFPES